MFYRRKVLLALVEAFGGTLNNVDCQKLLFLFCQRINKNYYDFFPYKYGSFSITSYHDRNKLADLGILDTTDNFHLITDHSFRNELLPEDQMGLQLMVGELGKLRGDELIKKSYLNYPQYASRSTIIGNLLSLSEYQKVSKTWNCDSTRCLFSLGYEGLSIDAYLNLLISNNIAMLIDIRKNPISKKYGFSKTKLSEYTKKAGLDYLHVPELGVPSNMRANLTSKEAYSKLFNYYESEVLSRQKPVLERLEEIIKKQNRVALMCFEADRQFCHRHKVIEYFEKDPNFGIPIVHLGAKDYMFNQTDDAPMGLFAI